MENSIYTEEKVSDYSYLNRQEDAIVFECFKDLKSLGQGYVFNKIQLNRLLAAIPCDVKIKVEEEEGVYFLYTSAKALKAALLNK